LTRSSGAGADQARRITPGFAMVLALSITSTVLLLIFGLVYYSGSSARIAGDYTSLASPANQALAAEMDGYTKNMRQNLAAARSDLMGEAQTEASFDSQLSQVGFPSAAKTAETNLIQADQARAKLIRLQAQASSFTQIQSFNSRVQDADAAVEVQVKLIRQDLALPPSSGQLY
jgi:hypothetical protein